MKVAVLGTTGMLGNYVYLWLKQQGYDVTALNRDELHITRQVHVLRTVRSFDVLVNCVGIIKQKADGVSEKKIIEANTFFPHVLQEICDIVSADSRRDCPLKLIHISTDCVFNGKPDYKNFRTESCPPNATDLYGRSKALGEPSGATVIRTSIVGSENKGKKSLLEWVKSKNNQEVDGYVNHHWNGVTCLQLAKFIENIIKNGSFWQGVRHYTSPHTISKFGLVRCIAHAYNLNVKVNPADAPEMKDMTLVSNYQLPLPPASIPDQLAEMLEFDRKNNLL